MNEDFAFTDIVIEGEMVNAVKILTGEFAKVIYYYGHVKIVPENNSHRLAYQYTIWDPAGRSTDSLKNSPAFVNLLGDILVVIIADESEEGEYVTPREHTPILDSEAWTEDKP